MVPSDPDLFTFTDHFFHCIYGRLSHFMGDEALPATTHDELAELTTEMRAGGQRLLEALAVSSSRISARITFADLPPYLHSLADRPENCDREMILVAPAAQIPYLSAVIQNGAWSLRACTSPGDVRSFLDVHRVSVILLVPPKAEAGTWWVTLLRTLPAGASFTLVHLLPI